jgi:hypothetical protein
VLGHPIVKPLNTAPTLRLKKFIPTDDPDASLLPDNARIIEIPLDATYRLDVLYLISHPYIDDMIERLNLKTHRIDK